ncbi:MAG: carboxypeptidase regulatory-like domain-containing protein, partial [Candidatus Hadarchaeum sp.]
SRGADWDKEEAYVYRDGIGFHYRELVVLGDMEVEEVVAKWEDLPIPSNSVGDLRGKVIDSSGSPVMGLIVSAGPYQTITYADGEYKIYGVPAGPCPVSVHSPNGEYYAQMAQVNVTAGQTTTHNFTVTKAQMVEVTFEVVVPFDHPEGGVPRIFGDVANLGFSTYFEGTAINTALFVDMEPDPEEDGLWTYTTTIGKGTYVKYFYTLGDHKLNRERDSKGEYVLRGVLVQGKTTTDDSVWSWKSGYQVPLNLEVDSPTDDTVYFTTTEWGGFAPIKMWHKGGKSWFYVLYVDPGNFSYKYLRNGDPEIGIEKLSPDKNDAFRQINVGPSGKKQVDKITQWRHQTRESIPSLVSLHETPSVQRRASGEPFQSGIELIDYWRPSWLPLVKTIAARISEHNAGWVQLPSLSGIISADPPIVDMGWNSFKLDEIIYTIESLHSRGLKLALRAFPYPSELPYAGFERHNTNDWYDAFYAEVKSIYLFHAKIAEQEDIELLILANFPWQDAYNPSSAAYINQKWKEVISEIRKVYSGPITVDTFIDRPEYDWYEDLDYIGDIWWEKIADTPSDTYSSMKSSALEILDTKYLPIYQRFNKPIIFTEVAYYSADGSATQQYGVYSDEISDFLPENPLVATDWQEQADAYEAVLQAIAEKSWVQGAYSFGYSFMDHDCKGYSIRAKTAEKVLSLIYAQFNAAE